MDSWLVVAIAVGIGAALWWLFRKPRPAADAPAEAPGSSMRLAQRGLDAVAHGLKLTYEDRDLPDQFDFAPFARGIDRVASDVLSGSIDADEVVAFHYSFSLDGEARPREFEVTTLSARFAWTGRLRLSALPREPGADPEFTDAWRFDEEPDGPSVVTDQLRAQLMDPRLRASALVVEPNRIVLIDVPRRDTSDFAEDVALLRRLRHLLKSS